MTSEGSGASRKAAPLTRLGSYEVIRPLAQGGMADIYLARHTGIGSFQRQVAIKVLNELRALDAEACALFLHEARVCAMLNHHNIAAVLDVDVADGHHYLAMEYIHGADLRELLGTAGRANLSVPYETAIAIIAAAAAGLDHAHRRCDHDGRPLRLVHRDVSLSNIMVGHDGSVKVVDFGIASTTICNVHTMPGVVRGKASYMSPEQCLGDPLDHRTDVFALGVVLYELTTGARCFHGKTDFDRMLAVVRADYIAPSQIVAEYPPELEQVVRTALAQDPAHRFASCAMMIEALEQVLAGRGWVGGTNAIARFMKQLFDGARPAVSALPEEDTAPAPALDAALATAAQAPLSGARRATAIAEAVTQAKHPSLARGSARRIARGTAPELYAAQPRELTLDDDDAPTRGRPCLKRPGTSPKLAA